ncbi:TonB-dependent siderophore receptor [Chroococcidiopsis sp. TS-821]|uniref:TonB-dependent siderophore receptor n=1 Tax=Chroococcidiopsis sp. TS-821 TaxID=1378066 RepID=UPI000CEEA585|nr:TonB-dependent siderophore receptor [Chroococcidiopsis sp. TS-821]PPS45605.1 TonB-dependent siderophore receptor [Chroococcidiopsis sp. TS-821]
MMIQPALADVRSNTLQQLTLNSQASIVEITNVQLNTDAGVEVVLITSEQLSVPATFTIGNTLIADIPNAILRIRDRSEFEVFEPTAEIASIRVSNLLGQVRIAITGTEAPPTAEISTATQGLVVSVVPASVEDDTIEILVTGEPEDGYFIPNASTATRTDTPILNIPQSIQVIPRQVLADQQVTQLEEALQNASGVIYNGTDTFSDLNYSIRGFSGTPVLQDGFRQYDFAEIPEVANIEQIEVLRGPSSILYGEIQPGGVINVVTKQPLADPFYEAELQVGSYGLIRPRIDISGPLDNSASVLYRLNALYSRRDSFRNFDQDFEQFFISPVLTWNINERTNLALNLQLSNRERPFDGGTVAVGNGVADVPRDRIFNEPDDFIRRDFLSIGYNLNHQLSNEWSIRNAFRYTDSRVFSDRLSIPIEFDEETGILTRVFALDDFNSQNYALQTSLIGEFATGSVEHTLLFGIDLTRTHTNEFAIANFTPFPINVFNPVYGVDRPTFDTLLFDRALKIDRLGVYLQDQIQLFDRLNLLLGLRYDTVNQRIDNTPALFYPGGDTTQNDDAWTPRVGIVYQPIEYLSLYASYSQSFNPNTGVAADGNPFEPEKGEGFEVGVKAELLDGNLLATLAYFDITKQNVLTEDPNFPGLGISIATGEQQSRGIEFDLTGQIIPGWNIIASYAYTDAKITEDNTIAIGNRLPGIPLHNASLWTTYQIQNGDFAGLGFGIGFNFVGNRQGDLNNSFAVDSYFLTNAAVFYQRDHWRFALNFKNLFDVNYVGSTGNFGSRQSAGEPGEPFTVIGSISVRF